MARLTDTLRNALGQWWNVITNAASEGLSAAQAVSTVSGILKGEGVQLSFADNTAIAQLYGYARRIENAGTAFTNADPSKGIDASMIADAPWARPEQGQNAYPIYNVKFNYTYLDAAGNTVTTTKTSVFRDGLPGTVGDLTAAVLDDAEAMANKYGHTLISAEPFQIQAV